MTGPLNVDEIAKGITFGSSGAYIQGETYGAQHVIRIASEDEVFLNANLDCAGQAIYRSFFCSYGTSDATATWYILNRKLIKAYDGVGAYEEIAHIYGDQDNTPRLTILKSGNLIPRTTLTYNLGSSTKYYALLYAQTHYHDTGDYMYYDRTNNRFVFYIGGFARGYIDVAGWHDGAP